MTKPESSLGIEGAVSQSRGKWDPSQAKAGEDVKLWAVIAYPGSRVTDIWIGGYKAQLPNDALATSWAFANLAPPAEPRAVDGGEAVHSSLPPAEIIQPSHDDEGLIERLTRAAEVVNAWKEPGHVCLFEVAANTISRLKGERDEARWIIGVGCTSNDYTRRLKLEAEVEELRRGVEGFTAKLSAAISLMQETGRWWNIEGHKTDAALWIQRADNEARALLSPRLVGVEGDEVITSPADPGSAKLRREGEG